MSLAVTVASPRHRIQRSVGSVGSAGGNCSGCRQMSEAIRLRKEQIQADILSKIGFDSVPRVTVPKLPPLGKTNELVQRLLRNSNRDSQLQNDQPRVDNAFIAPSRKIQKIYALSRPGNLYSYFSAALTF